MRSAEQDDFAPNPWKARALAAEAEVGRTEAKAEKDKVLLAKVEAKLETTRDLLEARTAQRDRLAAALRESDDMLRGWIAQMQDHPAYRGMALSSDTILREHAALSVLDRER